MAAWSAQSSAPMAAATATPTAAPVSEPRVGGHGYLYDLLRELGLSDFGARTGEFLLVRPVKIAGIALGAVLVARIGGRALRRAVPALQVRAPLRARTARVEQRARTFAEAAASLWRVVVWVVAGLMILAEVGVDLAPLLAGAGIAGLAIAFGAQSLIKDYLSGVLILAEDQFGVGDVVTIGAATGTVEDVNLRVTRMRSADGTVWFVPNGEIRQVGNQSMEWSRAVIDVTIGYDADLATVGRSLLEEAAAVAADPAWAGALEGQAELQGVQTMAADGVALRVVVRTAPGRQFAVAGELRSRFADRLRRDGVRGPGRAVLVNSRTLDHGVPPPPPAEAPPQADRSGRAGPPPGGR
jgi:small conductance mechanosensitive channel